MPTSEMVCSGSEEQEFGGIRFEFENPIRGSVRMNELFGSRLALEVKLIRVLCIDRIDGGDRPTESRMRIAIASDALELLHSQSVLRLYGGRHARESECLRLHENPQVLTPEGM